MLRLQDGVGDAPSDAPVPPGILLGGEATGGGLEFDLHVAASSNEPVEVGLAGDTVLDDVPPVQRPGSANVPPEEPKVWKYPRGGYEERSLKRGLGGHRGASMGSIVSNVTVYFPDAQVFAELADRADMILRGLCREAQRTGDQSPVACGTASDTGFCKPSGSGVCSDGSAPRASGEAPLPPPPTEGAPDSSSHTNSSAARAADAPIDASVCSDGNRDAPPAKARVGRERVNRLRAHLTNVVWLCTDLGLGAGARSQPHGLMVRCPWHQDMTPSCSVRSTDAGIYARCFACGAKGDVFALIAQVRGLHIRTQFAAVLREAERMADEMAEAADARLPTADCYSPRASRRSSSASVDVMVKFFGVFMVPPRAIGAAPPRR
jgi:hypothetical protein